MRAIFAAALAAFSISCFADPTFPQQLDGLAAMCSIEGGRGQTDADIALRDHGERSAQYRALVEAAFKATKACVDEGLPKGKEAFKKAASANPSLKPQMVDAYAAWVGYMHWLSIPRDYGEESPQEDAYEAARNRLQAELEIQ